MKKRLLLVGWDSADWKILHPLMDSGRMPGLSRLVETGVSGNLTTLEPQLSPMLWTSIATGKMAYHHGVPGFTEVDPRNGAVVPVSAATRRCRTLWEMLGEKGKRSHVVNWFATQGERDLAGCMVSNMFCHLGKATGAEDPGDRPPPPPGTYWPPELEADMNVLRVAPQEIDPDQVIRLLVPDAPAVDQQKDPRLSMLARKLAEAFSGHQAAVHLMERDPDWDFFAVYYRAIDEISHLFMPYHPPRMEGIPERDFELYRHVVDGTYRLHDLMLCRLLQLAGPDTSVMLVSDHGFHSDHLRPKFTPRVPAGITVWHRPQGVLVASGPGFKRDGLVHGARLLDVAPTVLHHFGLPAGDDMEGRVLEELFDAARPVETIPTWEPAGGQAACRVPLDEHASKALLQQFVDLGYIDELPDDPGKAAVDTQRENDWNMARAAMYGGRLELALPLLEACHHAIPSRTDYAQVLASCQLELGLLDEAEETLARALESFKSHGRVEMIRASLAIRRGDHAAALAALERVREEQDGDLQLLLMLAESHLALRRWDDAAQAAREVLAADPHNGPARRMLARVHLHHGRAGEALDEALDAIGLDFGHPMGHFLLGAALARQEEWAHAERPLLNCLCLDPDFLRARRLLARVYRELGDHDKSAICLAMVRTSLKAATAARQSRLAAVRRAASERRHLRDVQDQILLAERERRQAEYDAIEPMDFILVSGLPRSGTSLMMQMLRAGGIELMTDGERQADEDNPEGYWEWEEIKKLPKDPRILEQAKGKAVKVISALLPSLPGKHRYKVLYMVRPVGQVVDSQWSMLARRGTQPRSEKQHLIETQEQHSLQVRQALAKSERVELLEVNYPELIACPQNWVERIVGFLGKDAVPSPEKMAAVVRPELHRNR